MPHRISLIYKNNISLKQLSAHIMNKELSKPITDRKRKHQLDLISYFEKSCVCKGITNVIL